MSYSRKMFGFTFLDMAREFLDMAREFQDVAREFPEKNCFRIGKESGSFGYTITATALSNDLCAMICALTVPLVFFSSRTNTHTR